MGWNTAKDASGTTYYWNEAGASQYERPADFDEKVAQDAGSYTQYQSQPNPYSSGGGSGGGYGGGGGGGGYGGGYAPPANDYSNIGLQYSRPTSSYRDVQDGKPDQPADSAVADYWRKNDIKVYGGAPPPFLSFDQAQLPPQMMAAIAKAGFKAPSVIQAQTWPSAIAKRDIIGVAKTGSGKTLGFLVPGFLNVIQMRANPQMGPSILVLAPTRELASQIDVEAQKFGLPLGIRSVCIYGGAPKGGQLSQLRQGAHCVIGTPGRINDFREGGQLQLNQVMYLVMDEADRMLDMGFEPQIRKIVNGGIRPDRQTLFYTATWPKDVRKLAYEFLRSPVQVEVGDINTLNANIDITQSAPPMAPAPPMAEDDFEVVDAFMGGLEGGLASNPSHGGASGNDELTLPDNIRVKLLADGRQGTIAEVDGASYGIEVEPGEPLIKVRREEIEVVRPAKRDRIVIIKGELRGHTGTLIGIDGTDGILKMTSSDIKILDLKSCAKLADVLG